MHAFPAFCISLLSILPLVLSTPIPVWSSTVVEQPAVNDEASQARVAAYHEADARAGEMVTKMVTVANSDKPEHKKIVNDAFGPNANREKIKATIHNLNTKQVQIGTTDIAKTRRVATTPMPYRPDGPAGPINLGKSFFAADASKDFRAGTLIHEATHQQSYTGDFINTKDRIVGSLEDQKVDIKLHPNKDPQVGYHYPGHENPKKVPTSAADLSDTYKNNRDHIVKNMEDNADSYRVFAHLCSQPGIARRDIEIFSRALLEADADDHLYLAKRNSCALPKDYFEKKAAAKAAAAAGKGTKSINPTSHLTKGAATKGVHAQAVSKTARKPSALKAPTTGKGTKSIKPTSHATKGAAIKGARARVVSKAGGKASATKAPKVATKRVLRVASPRRTSSKGAPSVRVKSHALTKSTKQISHVAKGASKRTSRTSPSKAGRKSAVNALSRTAKPSLSHVPKVTSKRAARASPKAGRKSAVNTLSRTAKPSSHVPKETSKRTARASPKAGRKSVVNTLSDTARRMTSQRAQAKVKPVAQKKVAAALPTKSTPHAAPPKKAGK